MFGFPALYPGAFLGAAGLPLVGMIAVTLVWASGAISPDHQLTLWGLYIAHCLMFAWLAVRTHRMVLIGLEDPLRLESKRVFPLTFRYLAALTTGAALRFMFIVIVMALISLASYFAAGTAPGHAPSPASPTGPDPNVQRLIDFGAIVVQAPVIYLLARWSTLLPAIALGHKWSPATAWRQTRGNGWRLVLVVFLLPWAFSAAVEWANAFTGSRMLVGLLAIARSVFLALGIIALSLSYRELPPWPEPPPTTQPA